MEEFFPFEIGSDHESNIEADFLPWFESLMAHLQSTKGTTQTIQPNKYLKGLQVQIKSLNEEQSEEEKKRKANLSFAYKKYEKSQRGKILKVAELLPNNQEQQAYFIDI